METNPTIDQNEELSVLNKLASEFKQKLDDLIGIYHKILNFWMEDKVNSVIINKDIFL